MRKIRMVNLPLIVTFIITLPVISSCSKDNSKPASSGDYRLPGFVDSTITLNVPQALLNSSNTYAKYASSEIQSVTDMSGFLGYFVPPDNAENNNGIYQWTLPYNGTTLTFYWQYKEESDKYRWIEQVQFANSDTLDFVSAWESKSNETGEVIYNFGWTCSDPHNTQNNCQDVFYIYDWNKASDGTFTFDKKWQLQDTQSTVLNNNEFVINPDGSGSLKEYNMGSLNLEIEWDAQGNGTWTQYTGDTSQSGNWTV